MIEVETCRFVNSRVPVDTINILAQPRKIFPEEDLRILSEDIARLGLIHPLQIAQHDFKSCVEYLDYINDIRRTDYRVDDLTPTMIDRESRFNILIDGESRYRAIRRLQTYPCTPCQRSYGSIGCYERHFEDGLVDARLCINIPAKDALEIQYGANIHRRVPPVDEAEDIVAWLKTKRMENPRYSLRQFALGIGRSVITVTNALRFCKLPDNIKEALRKNAVNRNCPAQQIENGEDLGNISYGIALALSRLYDSHLSEIELKEWKDRAVLGHHSVLEFDSLVNEYLKARRDGQTMMWDFLTEDQREITMRANRREVISKDTVRTVHVLLGYFQTVLGLAESGYIDARDLPFNPEIPVYSVHSPRRVFGKVIDVESRLLPFLREIRGGLSHIKAERAATVIQETQETLNF